MLSFEAHYRQIQSVLSCVSSSVKHIFLGDKYEQWSQFYLYNPVSQITNVPQGALQSVQHRMMTNYRQEAKHSHTIHTERRIETSAQKERETRPCVHAYNRERDKRNDWIQIGIQSIWIETTTASWEKEIPGRPMVQHREAWVKREDKEEKIGRGRVLRERKRERDRHTAWMLMCLWVNKQTVRNSFWTVKPLFICFPYSTFKTSPSFDFLSATRWLCKIFTQDSANYFRFSRATQWEF